MPETDSRWWATIASGPRSGLNRAALRIVISAICLCSGMALAQGTVPLLQPGDALPLLAGETVAGRPLELPAGPSGKVAVIIFSFSRTGGRDAQNWAEHLAKDEARVPLYSAIFLESVPRLFRSLAVSGIRSGMPQLMLDHTLLVYRQQSAWEHRLHVTDDRYACVLVLNEVGRVRWISSGPFADSLYLRLKEELRP